MMLPCDCASPAECLQYAGGEQGLSADEIELAKLRREVAELRQMLASPLFNPPGSPGTTDGAAMTDEVKAEAAGITRAPARKTYEERDVERDERERRAEVERTEGHRAYLEQCALSIEHNRRALAMDRERTDMDRERLAVFRQSVEVEATKAVAFTRIADLLQQLVVLASPAAQPDVVTGPPRPEDF